jgi:NADH-quinone oxidoreductase subunit M
MGWILGFCVMASLGLPGLAGFWGEFPAILSVYDAGQMTIAGVDISFGLNQTLFQVLMVIAAIGTVFAAGYLLWLFQRVAFGTPTAEFANDPHITDVQPLEWLSWVPILVLIVVFGIAPGLMFNVIDPAVTRQIQEMHTITLLGGS